MDPKISVIVPVYQAEKYLSECINSILKQTLFEFELIIINDGSTDNSGKICNELAHKDSRIKVIHKNNRGPSSARNSGIREAKGNYIGFVDSDDVIEKNMFRELYDLAVKEDADIVACGYKEINFISGIRKKFTKPYGNERILEGIKIKEKFEELLLENHILGYPSMCNKLYKKSFIHNNHLLIKENIKVAEDQCFNTEAFLKANKICSIPFPFYNYRRINERSIMNTEKIKSLPDHLLARKEILFILKNHNIDFEIFKHCLQYENFKTVADYLYLIMQEIISKGTLKEKYNKINNFIHESNFLESVIFFNKKELHIKAKILLFILIFKLKVEKLIKEG